MTAPQTPSFPSLITRTTVLIAGGSQQVCLGVTGALTAAAAVFATIGAVRMVFADPTVAWGLVDWSQVPTSKITAGERLIRSGAATSTGSTSRPDR